MDTDDVLNLITGLTIKKERKQLLSSMVSLAEQEIIENFLAEIKKSYQLQKDNRTCLTGSTGIATLS